jgi:glutathione synthase/RimK-type ligase-like ATP-grasp enzyme
MRIALATCLALPEPDRDAAPLAAALLARGCDARAVAWDDPAADWSTFDACVVRSTWNYHRAPARFLAWCDAVARVTRLWNPAGVIRANAHKSYLLDLERRGVAVAPTVLLPRGATTLLADVMTQRAWDDVVVKPAVSAGSRDTRRVPAHDVAAGEAHLRALLAAEDVLVQRYLPSVDDSGERACVWIDGAFTHAVRKSPRFAGDRERIDGPFPLAPDERRLAEAALAPHAGHILYGRVDVARDAHGAPCVMEIELIEPSLFFAHAPHALDRFAGAIVARA